MFKTLNNKVLVKVLENRQENSYGLIVERKTDVAICEVLSSEGTLVKVGDKLLISKVSMAETPYGHMVDEKDILAIVD